MMLTSGQLGPSTYNVLNKRNFHHLYYPATYGLTLTFDLKDSFHYLSKVMEEAIHVIPKNTNLIKIRFSIPSIIHYTKI